MLLNKSHQNVKSNNNFESATEHQNILSQPALSVPKKNVKIYYIKFLLVIRIDANTI